MANEFRLPDIGEGLTEAEVVRWAVPVGGSVAVDETVVELETDKAVVEIPSPYAGVILHHGAAEGEVVAVGEVLVVVGGDGEAWPQEGEAQAEPVVGTLGAQAEELETVRRPAPARSVEGAVKALPLVRKLARDLGVDLAAMTGSGADGRITRDDVMTAADVEEIPEEEPAGAREVTAASADGERRPLSKLRRTIAANMTRAWAEIPHVTTFDEVDATRLLAMRAALERRHGTKVPMEALVLKAVIPVLEEYPELNATLDGDHLVLHRHHDLGIAVDTPEGLVVAVVRGAGGRSVLDLAAEVARLGSAAKDRSLEVSELSGQTFTVSNIGALGGGFGTPIVPPGTVAILSVGRAADKPVVRDGRITAAPLMPLSLSYDHRVVDGGLGRRFISMLIDNLEEPSLFLA